ncbi:MAG: 16S rRNA processing protein RimM [candidate division Zixibacteria bacterium]|nr:16S rRNA processing protein RimM [candidate division Zixibacteria bacterium]
MNDRVALGRIGKAHGVKGAFRLWPYADNRERFEDLDEVTLTARNRSMTVHITGVRSGKGFVLIETEEFESPEDIRPWINGELVIDESERVTLPDGQYFHDQIIGLRVQTTEGEDVGEIIEIIENAGNDVYVCRHNDHEFMIPAVAEFITNIDIASGVMTIAPIPGMIDEE